MIFPSFIKKNQKVIFSRFTVDFALFCLNQHENMHFSRFQVIFPSFIKKSKSHFLPIYSRLCLILLESAWTYAFLTISGDFSQFHKKNQKVIFSRFTVDFALFCLKQHENVHFSRFLMIFPSFIKKIKKSFSPDLQ